MTNINVLSFVCERLQHYQQQLAMTNGNYMFSDEFNNSRYFYGNQVMKIDCSLMNVVIISLELRFDFKFGFVRTFPKFKKFLAGSLQLLIRLMLNLSHLHASTEYGKTR